MGNVMLDQPLFSKNQAGKITKLEDKFVVSPEMENGLRILFGGKVLELMDEASGTLANHYLSDPELVAVHVGEEVFFPRPISSGEIGTVIAKVLLVTEKIICVHVEIWGKQPSKRHRFTRRYAGFGLCAVIDKNGKMIKDLELYRDPSKLTEYAEQVVKFQRNLRKSILKAR